MQVRLLTANDPFELADPCFDLRQLIDRLRRVRGPFPARLRPAPLVQSRGPERAVSRAPLVNRLAKHARLGHQSRNPFPSLDPLNQPDLEVR